MGLQPQVIALFCIFFIALGIFNVLSGRRRMQQGQGRGGIWYKQIGILTGIEYVLLGLAFLMNVAISYHWLPQSINVVAFPFYVVILLASGLLAGVVIYQGVMSLRNRRGTPIQQPQSKGTVNGSTTVEQEITPEQRTEYLQKRRERRQKAAQARRRRAGKA
jgi:hypothetical protein